MDSSDNKNKIESGRWSKQEHQRFMMGIALYGKDWKKVQEVVGTRLGSQVRSHAQKFFNKLQKQEKDQKIKGQNQGNINSKEISVSDSQNSLLKISHIDDMQHTTPIQLVAFIRKESEQNNKVDLRNLKKKLEQESIVIKQDNKEEQQSQDMQIMKRKQSFKSLNNILSAYQNLKGSKKQELEDQSFLINLAKRYKKFFSHGGKFENLIDFGNPKEVSAAERSIRKRSFTLPQGQQEDEQELNQRKKRVVNECNTAPLTDKQKANYRQVILIQKKQSKQNQKQENQQQENNKKKEPEKVI